MFFAAACLFLTLVLSSLVRAGDAVFVAERDQRTESAISEALAWLARSQQPDGSFGVGEYPGARTALALMAFMLQGHFPEGDKYADNMTKGVNFLIARMKANNGYVGGSMYEHGLATLALSEAWGMSDNPELRDTLKRAVDVILRAQDPSGGWKYTPRPAGADVSVTVMQIVALASAKEAGILVPDKTLERAVGYVRACQTAAGGFGYNGPNEPGFGRTAAGTLSLMLCGLHESPDVRRGLGYLRLASQGGSVFEKTDSFFYAHYYAMQVMYQAGEADYQSWYPRIRDTLLKSGGPSWREAKIPREVTTGMAVLILGVPYRYLPIYQR